MFGCVPRNLEGAMGHTGQGIRWVLITVCRQVSWQGKTAEMCTRSSLPSEVAWGALLVEKAAHMGNLQGEVSGGEGRGREAEQIAIPGCRAGQGGKGG